MDFYLWTSLHEFSTHNFFPQTWPINQIEHEEQNGNDNFAGTFNCLWQLLKVKLKDFLNYHDEFKDGDGHKKYTDDYPDKEYKVVYLFIATSFPSQRQPGNYIC